MEDSAKQHETKSNEDSAAIETDISDAVRKRHRRAGSGANPLGNPSKKAEMGAISMRGQAVFVRPVAEVGAMASNQRIITKIKTFLRHGCCHKEKEVIAANADVEHGSKEGQALQYRLEATRKFQSRSFLTFILSCGLCESKRSFDGAIGINPNQQLAMYLHWMFRVNFLFLFSVMCILFFAWVIFFAGFITIAGVIDEECVRIGGAEFGAANTEFADAFALSWTTFSTVGYGSTYPALGNENSSPTNCFFITFICSLESLLGVLYSGFCGAILFGKVLRIQSHAQVIFSDPIVIRYGPGVKELHEYEGEESEGEKHKIPCPVLEFRIVNRLYNDVGGEIMDATLNVVANVDANDADPPPADGRESERKSQAQTIDSDPGSEREGRSKRSDPLRNIAGKTAENTTIDEEGTKLVSKRIFSKMVIEASDHPFFKRVWLARHILDDTSPILKPRVRRQIRRNGGAWPDNLNSAEAVRESLQFNQILVSLNGVSNVSASDVYAQKIYDFVDINVGYQFVNLLYRDSDGVLKVDVDLLNDVREQRGGGGEPLIVDE